MPARTNRQFKLGTCESQRKTQFGGRRSSAAQTSRTLRCHVRAVVNIRAIVHFGLCAKPSLIRDFSIGGIGLVGMDALHPETEIEIALITGERKAGIVRWWLAGSCGIQFREPLGLNDPFRAALDRKAKPGLHTGAPDSRVAAVIVGDGLPRLQT